MIKVGDNNQELYESEYNINKALLCTHIAMLIYFIASNIPPMVYINIVSIIIYISSIGIIKSSLKKYYYYICFVEIYIYVIYAVYTLGWECGFQYYLLGLILGAFYGDFLDKKALKVIYKSKPFILSLICMMLFFLIRQFSEIHEPIYILSNSFQYDVLYSFNLFIVFVFFIGYSLIFSRKTRKYELMLENQALLDDLTKLYNRRKITKALNDLYISCKEGYCRGLAVSIMDIDDFKQINDTYGHNAGDLILTEIAYIIKRTGNVEYLYGRWGGEEFMIVCSGEDAKVRLENLLTTINKEVQGYSFTYKEQIIKLTVTAGVALYHEGEELDEMIARADKLLYIGKNSGKNKVVTEKET